MNWNNLLSNKRLRQSTRGEDPRNDFESDFGRIIFSPALRRMHDKTQVFPLTTDDNIHSRLTHSMEVMAVGHSLGIRLCENDKFKEIIKKDQYDLIREIPVLLKNACLVHDIGNPPFGHFGETVIQNYFKSYFSKESGLKLDNTQQEDFTGFDGNAQGFRVLTKLQVLNDDKGLNLTFATLASYIKYPYFNESDKKRGIFQSEKDILTKIADECGLKVNDKIIRHPLCYLMEAADSICYLTMDIEDGFNKNWYDFTFIENQFNDLPEIKIGIENIKKKLNGVGDEITKMVNFRIFLIGLLSDLAVKNFIRNYDKIITGNYINKKGKTQELIQDDDTNLAKRLGIFCIDHIFPKRDITSLELSGHSVITGLLDIFTNFVFHKDEKYTNRIQGLISKSILTAAFLENGLPEKSKLGELNDYYKLRVIVDFISGMTDQYALDLYQKLSGQKIS